MPNVSILYTIVTGNQNPSSVVSRMQTIPQLNNLAVLNDELNMLGLEVIPQSPPNHNPTFSTTIPVSNSINYLIQLKTTTRSEFRDNSSLIAAMKGFYKSKLEILTPGLATENGDPVIF